MNKKTWSLTVVMAVAFQWQLFAQNPGQRENDTITITGSNQSTAGEKNNVLKINLSALVLKNISVQYERKVGKRISLAANVRVLPFGQLPFLSKVEDLIDDPSVPVNQVKLGNVGITPEIRFYTGKRGALHGFYFAPFASFNNYKADLPIKYDNDTRTGIFNGKVSTITGGLMLGAQWNLSKTLSLDWWIVGPNYGGANGNLDFVSALSQSEQTSLRDALEELKNEDGLSDIIDSYTVNSSGAFIKAKGPWGGLRGLGFCLGVRF